MGRTKRGTLNHKAKLTEDDVREIRRQLGMTPMRVLAREYGVTPAAIRLIKKGKNWKHLD